MPNKAKGNQKIHGEVSAKARVQIHLFHTTLFATNPGPMEILDWPRFLNIREVNLDG
jgi:hypothetical protein